MKDWEKEELECLECGEKFIKRGNGQRYCCEKCRNRAKEARKRERRKAMRDMPKPKPKPKQEARVSQLAEINQRARNMGFTYGQYVARMKSKK